METKNIYVFADWLGLEHPSLIGILSAYGAKGKKAYGFEFDKNWLKRKETIFFDPDLLNFSGKQFPNQKDNFGFILDSMPDTWGRKLMKRKALQIASNEHKFAQTLHDIDFLLGVHDETRMGAIRFKTSLEGNFLDCSQDYKVPHWSHLQDLLNAAKKIEQDLDLSQDEDWFNLILAPGSSLGGARPKANVIDNNHDLWIAKFPSRNDDSNKAQWEYLAYLMACQAKITMSSCKIEKIASQHHTFFTKRFDRKQKERIHFASAMTMTGNTEITLRDKRASYLEIAEVIASHCGEIDENLKQLWRRIIFNIAISNTDDHLRNHGFLLKEQGWCLSPAYDLNPSIDKMGLALNIDLNNNDLSFELAKDVGEFFRLSNTDMNQIIHEVTDAVRNWRDLASKIGISRNEILQMSAAFNTVMR